MYRVKDVKFSIGFLLLRLAIVSIITYILASFFDLFERIEGGLRSFEGWEMDEVFIVIIVTLFWLLGELFRQHILKNRKFEVFSEETMIDAQTGILNRRGFFKTIEEKQSHLTNLKMKFTVYTFMLHPLKEINENYGYDLGNELITFSVLSLLRSKQEHDTIARISGNQFVIYSKSEAQFVLSFYNDLLENAFSQMDTYIAIDVQIKPIFAIASSPNDGKTIDEIMSIATKRMNKQVKA